MWISTEDAIKMYARFCRAHNGAGAIKKVRDRARELERRGDLEGRHVWNEVADEIRQLQQGRPKQNTN
jgi:hypothetical protein